MEQSQSEKVVYCIILNFWHSRKDKTESERVIARGLEARRKGMWGVNRAEAVF